MNITSINPAAIKCPVGSLATHSEFGWCEVIEANGLMRTVQYEVHTPDNAPIQADLPCDISPEEVIFSEIISTCEAVVDVRDLREARPNGPIYASDENRVTHLTKYRS